MYFCEYLEEYLLANILQENINFINKKQIVSKKSNQKIDLKIDLKIDVECI